jgi:hypothetical protein
MPLLLKMLQALFPGAESERAADDAFLSESIDIHDLECRMRTLDERGRNPSGGIALGLYTR